MTDSHRPSAAAGRSLIGADVTITGDIGAEGTVEVTGTVEGKIAARAAIVGAGGRVTGAISAETVDIRGQMDGKISCVVLILRSAAEVRADVNYQNLTIESGAQIEGRFTRTTSA
ncbi:bactofilin family protein [Gemmobacter serpentinus]|uniref:bactofilin family protein n=1 Tax=Gemmobacter serpentinus TaxID=2652247 RepID=UPI00124D4949|nr:polymer-forming cytoskeletal protein [Gemmobacter serpentinus]